MNGPAERNKSATPLLALVTYRNPVSGSRRDHDHGEDELIVAPGLTARGFNVTLTSLAELLGVERTSYDLIYVSNIAPPRPEEDLEFLTTRRKFYERSQELDLPIYNGYEADRDRNGKQYVLDLFRAGWPVIPTIDALADLAELPVVARYISRPKLGFSSRGCLIVGRDELSPAHFHERIVQPFYADLALEVSVYVIDGVAEYATVCPSKLTQNGWKQLREHASSPDERLLALRCAAHVTNGFVRVDLVRLSDDSLRLLEIEDNSAYSALAEPGLRESTKERILDALAASLRRRLSGYRKQEG